MKTNHLRISLILVAGLLGLGDWGIPLGAWAQAPVSVTGGAITIRTDLPDARVYIDGKNVGLSPVTLRNIEAGEHIARAEAQGRYAEKAFTLGTDERLVNLELNAMEQPMAIGVEGALGFRGSSSLLAAGFVITYQLPYHELSVVGDGFGVRGSSRQNIEGIIGRLEYSFVPFIQSVGPNLLVQPLKLRARVNVAQTTKLERDGVLKDDVAALGGGGGIAAEARWRDLGIEPSFFLDVFSVRSVGSGANTFRPSLNNGGLNLRVRYYLP